MAAKRDQPRTPKNALPHVHDFLRRTTEYGKQWQGQLTVYPTDKDDDVEV